MDGNEVIAAGAGTIYRLHEDSSVDLSFLASFTNRSDSGSISTILKDSAGNWLVGGRFNTINSSSRPNIARLLPNAAVDPAFANSTFSLPTNCFVNAMVLQPDGKLIVAGARWSPSYPAPGFIMRLQTNGVVDSAFQRPLIDGPVSAIALETDGHVLIGGSFSNVAGHARNQLCRIAPDGSIDESFNPAQLMPFVSGIKALPNGDILIHWAGGPYPIPLDATALPPTNSLVRLRPDGSLDRIFTNSGAAVSSVAIQPDGKYILTGIFPRNTDANRLCKRILPDDVEDPTFVSVLSSSDNDANFATPTGVGTISGFASGAIFNFPTIDARSATLDAQQRILLAGYFPATGQINPQRLIRLLNDNNGCVATFNFETNQMAVIETNGFISIPVIRTGDLTTTTVVQIYNPAWINDPTTFVPLETNIVFTPGTTRQNVVVPIHDNGTLEPNRQITLQLRKPTGELAPSLINTIHIVVADASSFNGPGSVDGGFIADLGSPYDGLIAVAPDQKIFVASGYSSINGIASPPLARLNPDGSLDTSFHFAGSGFPIAIAAWKDNIYVLLRHSTTNSLLRLLSDGSVDPTFQTSTLVPIFSNDTFTLLPHEDGRVLISGRFAAINNVVSNRFLVRINADGSNDTSFDPGAIFGSSQSYRVMATAQLLDGSYLIGGDFPSYLGQDRHGLVHISASGTLLDDYVLPARAGVYPLVFSIAKQLDHGFLIGGGFGLGANGPQSLLRFTANGVLDDSFQPPSSFFAPCTQVLVESDGKIIITGETGPDSSGVAIRRLNADGSFDPGFYPGYVPDPLTLALDSSDRLYARGRFQSFNGWPRSGLVRLLAGPYSGAGIFTPHAANPAYKNQPAKLTIRRSASTQGEAHLRLTTRDGSARAGEHYVPIDTEIIFADGEAEKEVEIPLIDNPARADSLYFYALLAPESPNIALSQYGDTIFIADDETGFVLSSSWSEIPEGGTVLLTVHRIGPFNGPASVEIATDGGAAIAGVDYVPIAQTLHFDTSSNLAANVILQTLDNNSVDGDKTIRVILRNPTGPVSLLDPSTNTFTLRDNAERFSFVPPQVDVVQNDRAAKIEIAVANASYGRPGKRVTISYKTDGGTAIPGVEYIPQQGSLTFLPYDNGAKSILIPLLPNSIVGDPTTIQLKATITDGEAIFTNVGTIFLHHPKAVIPAGTIDTAFSALHEDVWGRTYSIAQVGNYIYTQGDFLWPFSGSTNGHSLVRFDLNGALDRNYYLDFAAFPILPVDGRILVQTTWAAYPRNIIRIDTNGAVNPNFSVDLPIFYRTYQAALTSNAKIILAGSIEPSGMNTRFAFLTQLQPNGSVDDAFGIVSLADSTWINAIALQPDGQILVGGGFSEIAGVGRTNIARLKTDGHVDLSFCAPTGVVAFVNQFHVLSTGKILAGGSFITSSNSTIDILLLNADGSVDTDFYLPPAAADAPRDLLAIDAQDRIYIRAFTGWTDSAQSPYTVSRFLPNGVPDPEFRVAADMIVPLPAGLFIPAGPVLTRVYADPPNVLRPPELLPNGRIAHTFNFPANVSYILEQTADFQTWTEILSGASTDGYVHVETDAPIANRFYRVRSK